MDKKKKDRIEVACMILDTVCSLITLMALLME